MPRIRTVKPEFWAHPVMGRASDAAKCLALALLNIADDEGYFQASPTLVRNFARPFDAETKLTSDLLSDLVRGEWIELRDHPTYGALGWVVKFKKHQRVNRARKSELRPYFDASPTLHCAITESIHTQITAPSLHDHRGKGMEGNGREEKSSNARARAEEPAAAAWDQILLAELRTAFGAIELADNDFAGFLISAARFPKPQREDAARAFLARGLAAAGKRYGYLLRMIEGGASDTQNGERNGAAMLAVAADFGPPGRQEIP